MKIHLMVLLLCGLVMSGAPLLARGQQAPADSFTVLPDFVVSSEAVSPPAAGRIILDSRQVSQVDAGSLAELGNLLPSTRVTTNSRGEATLMIRGAPERHVQTFLDGIPLNLPWDERVDLSSIPVTGAIRLEGRRGLSSLLEGPGALAGSVRILPGTPRGPTTLTRAVLGQYGLSMLNSAVTRRSGPWDLQGGLSWRNRDAWPLPNNGPARFNSDLDQYALLGRASRSVGHGGRVNFLITRWHEAKGVPPELNLGEAARFWRYPLRKRTLGGVSLHWPLGVNGNWDLGAMVAMDFFTQEIDPRGPDQWGSPLQPGQDYEHDKDRTNHLMLGLTRWVNDKLRVTLQGNTRHTRHEEILAVGESFQTYSQWLSALVVESTWQPTPRWTVRGGAGSDYAKTPLTGNKPDRGANNAPALNLRLQHNFGTQSQIYIAASRRSRFPSLREMFSGALGKFVPNPNLRPERQDLYESGLATRGNLWRLTTALFLQNLHGGIEKEKLSDGSGRFMRLNRTEIHVRGGEIMGSFRPSANLTFTAQHTSLWARVQNNGHFSDPAEDRPDYLSLVALSWQSSPGPTALLEAQVTGPRWSADASEASDATDGLKHLPAGVSWNLRVGYRWLQDGRKVAVHIRINNLFDQAVSYQVGLPEPGRIIAGGLSLEM